MLKYTVTYFPVLSGSCSDSLSSGATGNTNEIQAVKLKSGQDQFCTLNREN